MAPHVQALIVGGFANIKVGYFESAKSHNISLRWHHSHTVN